MEQTKKHAIIIGSGIGGLSLAGLLGKRGYKVTVLEKNEQPGGRANVLTLSSSKGDFLFDKGPSWYMMPDVFEHFFTIMEEDLMDYLRLTRLSPSYRVFMESTKKTYDFYSDIEKNASTFETLEAGSGTVLKKFLKDVGEQYTIAKNEFLSKNYNSIFDFVNWRVMILGAKLPLFKKQSTIINNLFTDEVIRKVMQYQTVLLGTSPFETPGIYTLMNYVDFVEGVWYPDKGIYEVPKALITIAQKYDVSIQTKTSVSEILVSNGIATGVKTSDGNTIFADIVISNADSEFTDQTLLPKEYRTYTPAYWEKRQLAPSAFILYLGIDGKIPSLSHHNLLFSKQWEKNFDEIFTNPTWPTNPALYVCAPSVTDPSVAPPDTENLFVLVPIAAGLQSTPESLLRYRNMIIERMTEYMDIPDLKNRILVEQMYSVENFIKDYNAFKGTALGLAHTLSQTAIFRPNNVSKKVKNLFFVGAGTNPGIGMPICLLSAELTYKRIEHITHSQLLRPEEV